MDMLLRYSQIYTQWVLANARLIITGVKRKRNSINLLPSFSRNNDALWWRKKWCYGGGSGVKAGKRRGDMSNNDFMRNLPKKKNRDLLNKQQDDLDSRTIPTPQVHSTNLKTITFAKVGYCCIRFDL